MKLTITFSIVLLAISLNVAAQETGNEMEKSEPIETDRPDQTETPAIVPKHIFQMENGFSFEKNDRHSKSFILPTSLMKYGVNGNFELRLITEFSIEDMDGTKISGLNPLLIGFKAALAEEKGIWPKTSIIAHLMIPELASEEFKTTYYAPSFRFTMQHTLTDKINLGYNLGAEWDGESPEPTFIYTMTCGLSLSEKLGCYGELYGFAPQKNKADHRFDGGFTYLITDNVMIDASGGFGISANAPDYYTALGFSFRL